MSVNTLGLSMGLDQGLPVSQYQGWPFTGFFELGGQQYGVCPDGIYLLNGGADDAGSDIEWQVSGPMTDAGAPEYKRVRRLAVSGEMDDVTASVAYESGETPTMGEQLAGGMFYVGRDGAGRESQFTLSGTGQVSITGVTMDLIVLGRRARG